MFCNLKDILKKGKEKNSGIKEGVGEGRNTLRVLQQIKGFTEMQG